MHKPASSPAPFLYAWPPPWLTRFNRIWVVLLALVLLLLTQQWLASFIDSRRLVAGFYTATYCLWFGLLTWLVLVALTQRFVPFNPYHWLAGIWLSMLTLAALMEISELMLGRPLALAAVFSSMLGTTAVLAIWARSLNLIPGWSVWTGLLLMAMLATIPMWQARALQAYRDSLAPDLVRFDEQRASRLWTTDHAARVVTAPNTWTAYQDQTVLELIIADTEEPAWRLAEPIPDWSAFQYLVVDLYQAERWPLYLRVELRLAGAGELLTDGVWHEGFELPAGETELRIPLRSLPAGGELPILDLALVTSENYQGRALYLGSVRLE